MLGGCWHDNVLNVHVPTDEKSVNMKDGFHRGIRVCIQSVRENTKASATESLGY
jgi:hypothetical protein